METSPATVAQRTKVFRARDSAKDKAKIKAKDKAEDPSLLIQLEGDRVKTKGRVREAAKASTEARGKAKAGARDKTGVKEGILTTLPKEMVLGKGTKTKAINPGETPMAGARITKETRVVTAEETLAVLAMFPRH